MATELSHADGLTRRRLLLGGAAATGGLLLAVAWMRGGETEIPAPTHAADVGAWLHVGTDGWITLYSNAQEMGQGSSQVVPQILAEELELQWQQIRVAHAPLTEAHGMWGTRQGVGGSSTVRSQFDKLRKAGAATREMLVAAAALRWSVAAEQCRAEAGSVVHAASGRRLGYAAVAELAATLPVPPAPVLKPRAAWSAIGADLPRKDLPGKVDGSARYAIDVKLPGMLVATLRQAPRFGARLGAVDAARARAMPGVHDVIEMRGVSVKLPSGMTVALPDAVAVLAGDFWTARNALEQVGTVWDAAGAATDSEQIARLLRDATEAPLPDESIGLSAEQRASPERARIQAGIRAAHDAARGGAVRTIEAGYEVPFLAHAQMEPLGAVARVGADSAEIWAGTQNQSGTRDSVATLLGLKPEQVTVNTMLSGGAFGRRFQLDFTLQAAFLARAAKAPVQLLWSREEDMQQGRYRPAGVAKVSTGLDAGGMPVGMRVIGASASSFYAAELVGETGVHDLLYPMPGLLVGVPRRDTPVPIGQWRSVTHSINGFVVESFIDELAAATGSEPMAYRRRLLAADPRALRVLDTLATQSDWNRALPTGRGRGMAIWRSFGSIGAIAVELSLDAGRMRIGRIVAVLDAGTAINPRNTVGQVEGSIVMALTAALSGEITIGAGAVQQSNFHDHPLLGLAQVPPIVTVLLSSPEAAVGGVGEVMVPPLAPALANAIVAAGGARPRTLPLSRQELTLA